MSCFGRSLPAFFLSFFFCCMFSCFFLVGSCFAGFLFYSVGYASDRFVLSGCVCVWLLVCVVLRCWFVVLCWWWFRRVGPMSSC